MPTRSFSTDKLGRRKRSRRAAAGTSTRGRDAAPPMGERPERDPSQDTAVYSCQCGMVFEAQVNTSVDCPHCGGHQAW